MLLLNHKFTLKG